MPQEELDLLQLASRSMAKPSTGPPQIVWRQLRHADALGGFLHNVPNRLHRHAISPCPSNFVEPTEQFSSINSSCGEPIVEFGSHPIRNRNCSNVASLADQINNGPMLFALLEVIQSQRHGFMPGIAARVRLETLMLGRVFLSVVDDRVLAKELGPAPRSANCRVALPTSSRP